MTRKEIVAAVIGKPWAANARGPHAYDCYHLFAHLSAALFGRSMADAAISDGMTYEQMMVMVATHPERRRWREVVADGMGLINAPDGAAVLMGRVMLGRKERLAHVGMWLSPERLIIHADRDNGVIVDDFATLKMRGWLKLRFFECTDR